MATLRKFPGQQHAAFESPSPRRARPSDYEPTYTYPHIPEDVQDQPSQAYPFGDLPAIRSIHKLDFYTQNKSGVASAKAHFEATVTAENERERSGQVRDECGQQAWSFKRPTAASKLLLLQYKEAVADRQVQEGILDVMRYNFDSGPSFPSASKPSLAELTGSISGVLAEKA
ncbi:hypothetical protein H2201_003404 [Coniosporium apollinis]|uniref:Uncharacterized protein n=2 Tax=Coniosporium TaxID=2810619 RepID=A0ABQ9NVR3_9PEZI|nr:hypothetical protein H2199_002157 [Cladosporium sp. JES 115]KAJ9666482.1 hypothetical protein H2201_003404 [Coniosporium apollinis]